MTRQCLATWAALLPAVLIAACPQPNRFSNADSGVPDGGTAATSDGGVDGGRADAGTDAGNVGDVDAGPVATGPFSAVWVTSGLDKVWQYERRATSGQNVKSAVWDGDRITLKAAIEETPGVNLIVETNDAVAAVSVAMGPLTGPGGFQIANAGARTGNAVFSNEGTPLQVSRARYVQITGINNANFGYTSYFEERVVPEPMRLPADLTAHPAAALCDRSFADGAAPDAGWTDRPGANQYVPNVLIPMEVEGHVDVPAQSSQLFALDFWLSQSVIGSAPPAGLYSGEVTINVAGRAAVTVPIELTLVDTTLPYAPQYGLTVYSSFSDTTERMYSYSGFPQAATSTTVTLTGVPAGFEFDGNPSYIVTGTGAGATNSASSFNASTGVATMGGAWMLPGGGTVTPDSTSFVVIGAPYADIGTEAYTAALPAQLQLDQLLHSYRIAPINDVFDVPGSQAAASPPPWHQAQLTGAQYGAAKGYFGPGQSTGDYSYFLGEYGGWTYLLGTVSATTVQAMLDGYANWFSANAPDCDVSWYVTDEPSGAAALAKANTYLGYQADPNYSGPGKDIPSLITYPVAQYTDFPDLKRFVSSPGGAADTATWSAAVSTIEGEGRQWRMYNGSRAGMGSAMIEDTGISNSLWPLQNRFMKAGHHFYWQVNYYDDSQTNSGLAAEKNVYDLAMTFGELPVKPDPLFGWTTFNGANGDGVLVYPGRDKFYPANDYGLDGFFPSFRLRAMRLGINAELWADQAAAIDPDAVTATLTAILGAANSGTPQISYDIGVFSTSDPTYQYGGVTWSEVPSDYETLRLSLMATAGY